jgi:PAS domain S-box-containing protein
MGKSLTLKMVVVTVAVGIAVWAMLDYFQNRSLKEIFQLQLADELGTHAVDDRIHFDNHVKTFHQSVKLFVSRKAFVDYVEGSGWSPEDAVSIRNYTDLPLWLPKASALRAFSRPRYAMLLDAWGRVREVYHGSYEMPPRSLLRPTARLIQQSHNQSHMTSIDGLPYMVTSESIGDAGGKRRASLMLASPIDSEFLVASQGPAARGYGTDGHIVALVTGDPQYVITSSDLARLPAGTALRYLGDDYLITGQELFDYGSSDLMIGFTSLISTEDMELLTTSVIGRGRMQRAIMALGFIISFALIMFYVTKRIGRLTRDISDFSREALGSIQTVPVQGDELDTLEARFKRLTEEIVLSNEIIGREAEERAIRKAELETKEGLLKLLQSVTEALGVGVLIKENGDLIAANRQMEYFVQACGGTSTFRIDQGGEEERHLQDKYGIRRVFHLTGPSVPSGENVILVQDISERKQAEEELRESEERFRTAFQTSPDAVYISSMDGRYIDVNEGFTSMTGYSRQDVIGRASSEIGMWLDPEDRQRLMEKVGKEGHVNNFESDFRGKAGRAWTGLISSKKISMYGETFMLTVTRDITERKAMEKALAASEERFRALFNQASDCILLMESLGSEGLVIVDANIAACRMHGYERDEIIGKPINFLDDPDTAMHVPERAKRLLAGDRLSFEGAHVRKDGTVFPVDVSAQMIKIGEKHYTLAIDRDITERKMAEKRIQRHLEQMNALRTIDMAVTESLDLQTTVQILIDQMAAQFNVDAVDILLYNPHSLVLEYASGRGFRTGRINRVSLRVGEGYAGQAARERRNIIIPDLPAAEHKDIYRKGYEFSESFMVKEEGFRAYQGIPLIAKGQVKGVLEIFYRNRLEPDREWIEFLNALTGYAAIAVDNAVMFNDLQLSHDELVMAYDKTMEGWSRALDYRDKETEGHSRRVTDLSIEIAQEMGIKEQDLVHVRRGALLHDIGKLGVPDRILLKKDTLTEEEFSKMKRHPEIAHEILSPIDFLRPALDIPYCHHERWDGMGYPRGLKAEQIPLPARIFAVVDVWDALSSDRPYRPAWDRDRIIEHLLENAGSHFDPKVVEIFINKQSKRSDRLEEPGL